MSEIVTRIAIPTNDGETVSEHFGHSRMIALADISEGRVTAVNQVQAPEHAPGVFPRFMGEQGAHVVITGGMGRSAAELLDRQNIRVILGASGTIKENLEAYLKGELHSRSSACEHHHGDHHHGEHHGEHHHDKHHHGDHNGEHHGEHRHGDHHHGEHHGEHHHGRRSGGDRD